MEKKAMFGELGSFADRKMFDSHRYGNLYFNEKDHGIEFFAFVHTDAYDGTVFTADVRGEARQAYLDNLLAKAIQKRDIGATIEDRILLLTTCSSASTNGRDILVGRITRELYEDTFIDSETNNGRKQLGTYNWGENSLPWSLILILFLLLAALITLLSVIRKKRKRNRRGKTYEYDTKNKNPKGAVCGSIAHGSIGRRKARHSFRGG
jgi:sortase B